MIPLFALQLICGLSTVWTISKKKEITSGFFRIQMLLALGLSVLLALTVEQLASVSEIADKVSVNIVFACAILISILSFSGSIAWTLERRKGGAIFSSIIAILSSGCISFIVTYPEYIYAVNLSKHLELFDSLTSAWFIGSATAAMLIGHWYLTATGMKLEPFIEYNRLFIFACLLRIIAVVIDIDNSFSPSDTNWSLLILRWAGLIGPLIMAILTIRILKYRNTQSATGLLYAATTLVFMGEMASHLID